MKYTRLEIRQNSLKRENLILFQNWPKWCTGAVDSPIGLSTVQCAMAKLLAIAQLDSRQSNEIVNGTADT